MKKTICITVLVFCCTWIYGQKPVFNHAAIYVSDLQKSKIFYEQVVGLDTIANPFRDDKHVWFVMGGGTELHVIAGATTVTQYHQDNHLCFRVQSVEALQKNL